MRTPYWAVLNEFSVVPLSWHKPFLTLAVSKPLSPQDKSFISQGLHSRGTILSEVLADEPLIKEWICSCFPAMRLGVCSPPLTFFVHEVGVLLTVGQKSRWLTCRMAGSAAGISEFRFETMKSIISFLAGIIFALVVLVLVGYVVVKAGFVPANADSKPTALERWVAMTALHAALERDTKGLTNPVQPSDENLITGVHLYAENCAICHGASDAKPSNLAQGFYIEAPQLAKDGVEDDPEAVSFWKVKHGIRFTAMPSFAPTLQDEQIWKIAMFLKQMDKLPPAVDAEWKKVPSVAATPPPK